MNKERLTKLADFVEANARPTQFNMSKFFSNNVHTVEDLRNDCGTTACLAGWGCLIPEFQEAGLGKYSLVNAWGVHNTVIYEGLQGFDGLEAFFDLTEEQAEYLFGEFADQNETIERDREPVKAAVHRVRQFVADGICHWEESDLDDDDDDDDDKEC